MCVCANLNAAASIWFQIWEVVDPGQKILIFPGKFQKNFDFSRHIFEKFRFLSGKTFLLFSHLLQNFRLSRQNFRIQLNSGQIILFRLKSHHVRSYFLYMMRHNNISQPPATPTTPGPKSGGVATPPTPRIDAYACMDPCKHVCP